VREPQGKVSLRPWARIVQAGRATKFFFGLVEILARLA
jgi:hypothetical protein